MNKFVKLSVLLVAILASSCRGGRGQSSSSQPMSSGDQPSSQVSPSSEQSTTASSQSSSQSEDTNTFSTSIAGISRELTVTTSGADFTDQFNSGVQIVNNVGTFVESSNFITFFNANALDPLLWKIAGINVMANENGVGENKLKIGSKSEGAYGELSLMFNYDVTKIEISAMGFYKYDSYNSKYNVDTATSISIDDDKTSLACAENTVPTPVTVSKTYSTPTKLVKLSTDECDGSSGQRVFIDYIKITYIA